MCLSPYLGMGYLYEILSMKRYTTYLCRSSSFINRLCTTPLGEPPPPHTHFPNRVKHT